MMTILNHDGLAPPMALGAQTAADLMTAKPITIGHRATVSEAAMLLARRGISAVPVIDDRGRAIGVVSRTDILIHKGQRAAVAAGSPGSDERRERVQSDDTQREDLDRAAVADVMTPGLFCVRFDTAAVKVVERMLRLKVRRLFVVDEKGVLTGVISAFDVLRNLRRWGEFGE